MDKKDEYEEKISYSKNVEFAKSTCTAVDELLTNFKMKSKNVLNCYEEADKKIILFSNYFDKKSEEIEGLREKSAEKYYAEIENFRSELERSKDKLEFALKVDFPVKKPDPMQLAINGLLAIFSVFIKLGTNTESNYLSIVFNVFLILFLILFAIAYCVQIRYQLTYYTDEVKKYTYRKALSIVEIELTKVKKEMEAQKKVK